MHTPSCGEGATIRRVVTAYARTGLGKRLPLALITTAMAQVVQVSIGGLGQLCEALIAEHVQGAFAEFASCWA